MNAPIDTGGFIGAGQKPKRSPVRSWKGRPIGNGEIQYCGCCGKKAKIHPGRDQFNCQHCGVLALWRGPFFSTPFVKT